MKTDSDDLLMKMSTTKRSKTPDTSPMRTPAAITNTRPGYIHHINNNMSKIITNTGVHVSEFRQLGKSDIFNCQKPQYCAIFFDKITLAALDHEVMYLQAS